MQVIIRSNKGQVTTEILISLPIVLFLALSGIYVMLALQSKLWLKHYAYEYAVCVHYQKPRCKKDNVYIIKKLFPYLSNIKSNVTKLGNRTIAKITAECFGKKLVEQGVFNE